MFYDWNKILREKSFCLIWSNRFD